MVLSNSASTIEHTTIGEVSKTADSIFNEREDKKSVGKKVRFSQPLEYRREYDNTHFDITLPEIKNKTHLPKPRLATSVKSASTWDINSSTKCNVKRTKGVRSITDAVQAFRTDDEKNSVRKFIAHYKRTTVRVPDHRAIQHRTVHSVIVSEFEKVPSESLPDGKKESDEQLCKLCCSGTSQSAGTYLPSYYRSYVLPSINSQRKTFDERLLPFAGHSHNCEYLRYLRMGGRTQSTPLIVQLFE